MTKLSCFKQVSDPDFWQSKNDGTVYVEVTLTETNYKGDSYFRVSVWNNDDLGREIDAHSYAEALSIYLTLLSEDKISDDLLTDNGFVGA